MPLYSYTAIDTAGNERKGRLQAADKAAASQTLRAQGLYVASIDDASARSQRSFDFSRIYQYVSVPNRQLIFFFKQLAFMLKAGLPVLQSLQMSEVQSQGRLRWVLKDMIRDIQNGSPVSKAMENQPDVFPSIAVNLMKAGENTGELDVVAQRLAVHMEKKAALRSQTINAMIYPSVVILFAIGVVIFLVWKIIPKFAQFLMGRGKKLPDSTQFLIDLSNFILANGLYIFGSFFALIVILFVYYRTAHGRLAMDRFSLKLPVVGNLLLNSAMAELNWSVAMMLKSGLTAYDALKISSQVIRNKLISNRLKFAADLILNGKELSTSLSGKGIPSLVTQMTAVGEKTGTLDQVMFELGVFYEELLQVGIKRMTALIEPVMILVIGTIVGFVYYAFFQALFSLVSKG